ncbi:MAG: peptide deformylase [Bacteroidales bacterium]|nr:peptide deformylase [Bacteroidales bacterium]
MIRRYFIFPILSIIVFFIGACKQKLITFNDSEIDIITTFRGSIMPLVTINSETDSLFLRKLSAPLNIADVKSEYFISLANSMLLTVTNPENEGVGIAAPQVGVSKQLIAVQRIDKEGEPFEFYVNPKIVSFSGDKKTGGEGCLSVPGMKGLVDRYQEIVIEYNDIEDFTIKSDTVEGFTAVIFQHEIDHLNGILYIDKANNLTDKTE